MKLLRWIALIAIITATTSKSNAASPAPVKTNWVSNLSFTLTAWKKGTSIPMKASSKDIIASLNGAAIGTSVLNFPKTAQLLWKEVLSTNAVVVNGLGTNAQVIVRKRLAGKNVDTDVSSFFSRSTTLSVGVTNSTGVVKRQVGSFAMTNSKLAFSLASFATQTDASVLAGRPNATKEASCIVTGAGQSSGTPMAFSGTIQTSGGKLE